MPDNKSISQLTPAEQTTSSDLFETAIPNGSLGYLSRKVSLDAIANFIAKALQYSDLQTEAKTLIDAINEAAQSGGGGGASIEEMTQAQYDALTPEQKADGTLRAISDAKTSINDIDDVNLSSPADGDALIYDGTSGKWVNSGLADKMDKVNPTGTGSFSLNRKANTIIGTNSFAEGYDTTASGNYSHAEGSGTTASGSYSHAEGYSTTASGAFSHAEGSGTTASGSYSHAEGRSTTASGAFSHAEGNGTTASGYYSQAEGNGTTASHASQHVMGEYNALDNSTAAVNERGNYVEIVGNGTANNRRSNARTLDWSGNEVLSGTIEATGFGATLKQAVIDEVVDNGFYHIGDTVSLLGLALSCYSTSFRMDIYVPLPKDFDTSSVSLSISGTWRLIFTPNDTLDSVVVLNNAALSTIGTVSVVKLTGGISIRVALNSGVIGAWGVGTIYGTGSNNLTFSSI